MKGEIPEQVFRGCNIASTNSIHDFLSFNVLDISIISGAEKEEIQG